MRLNVVQLLRVVRRALSHGRKTPRPTLDRNRDRGGTAGLKNSRLVPLRIGSLYAHPERVPWNERGRSAFMEADQLLARPPLAADRVRGRTWHAAHDLKLSSSPTRSLVAGCGLRE
jgi:hypothetical protein